MSGSDKLMAEDYEEIRNTLNLWAFLIDARAWERAGEVYAPDISFNSPRVNVDGLDDLVKYLEQNEPAKAHHITNLVIAPSGPGEATVRYKTLTFNLDDRPRMAEVTDMMVKTADGWRVARREIERRFER